MAEFDAGGRAYRSKPLCAADQWRLLHRLRPILPALTGLDVGMRGGTPDLRSFATLLAPLMAAPDDDVRFVFAACLNACERLGDEGWGPADERPGLADLMAIATHVVAENFGALFAMERPRFEPIRVDRPHFEAVALPDGEDLLFRPVLRRLCSAESLYDGTLRIEHVAKLNDVLDVAEENEVRARKAAEKK